MVVVAAHTPCQGRAIGRGTTHRPKSPIRTFRTLVCPILSRFTCGSCPASRQPSQPGSAPYPAATAHGLTTGERRMEVRCRKKHKGKERDNVAHTRRIHTHRTHRVCVLLFGKGVGRNGMLVRVVPQGRPVPVWCILVLAAAAGCCGCWLLRLLVAAAAGCCGCWLLRLLVAAGPSRGMIGVTLGGYRPPQMI